MDIQTIADQYRNDTDEDLLRLALEPQLAAGARISGLFDDAGEFRTFPGEQRTDGFFASTLERESGTEAAAR